MRKKLKSRKKSLSVSGKRSSGVRSWKRSSKKSVKKKPVRSRSAGSRAAERQTARKAAPAAVLILTALAVLRQVQVTWNCYRQLSIAKLVISLTKDNWR